MRYWISFDLGLRGNYDNLYEWLDRMDASECGDFMATFKTDKTYQEITKELEEIVNEKSRIYLILYNQGGRFIVGKRKRPPWAGYALGTEETGIEK